MVYHSLVVLFILLAAEIKSGPSPRYDPGAVVDLPVVVTEVHNVSGENGLSGVQLLVRTEADVPLDVYLGPADFVKEFDITFAKGDRIQIVGSKIKLANGSALILAREIRKNSETLYLRDKSGEPFWHTK